MVESIKAWRPGLLPSGRRPVSFALVQPICVSACILQRRALGESGIWSSTRIISLLLPSSLWMSALVIIIVGVLMLLAPGPLHLSAYSILRLHSQFEQWKTRICSFTAARHSCHWNQ
jgi:hypothetical protein